MKSIQAHLSILAVFASLATAPYLVAEPGKPIPDAAVQVKARPTPAELTATRCLTCHGDPVAGQKRLAPPFAMMKMHYKALSKEEFVEAVSSWVKEPAKQKSRMPGAVNRFGLMPAVAYPDEEITAIAQYIYKTDFPMPGRAHGRGRGAMGNGMGNGMGNCGDDCGDCDAEAGRGGCETDGKTAGNATGVAKKWPVPAAMSAHFRRLEKNVREFDGAGLADHTVLGTSISKDLNQLIASCSMDGEAHDALHQWLMPLMKLTKEHAKSDDLDVKKKKIGEMRRFLSAFHAKFKLAPPAEQP